MQNFHKISTKNEAKITFLIFLYTNSPKQSDSYNLWLLRKKVEVRTNFCPNVEESLLLWIYVRSQSGNTSFYPPAFDFIIFFLDFIFRSKICSEITKMSFLLNEKHLLHMKHFRALNRKAVKLMSYYHDKVLITRNLWKSAWKIL